MRLCLCFKDLGPTDPCFQWKWSFSYDLPGGISEPQNTLHPRCSLSTGMGGALAPQLSLG